MASAMIVGRPKRNLFLQEEVEQFRVIPREGAGARRGRYEAGGGPAVKGPLCSFPVIRIWPQYQQGASDMITLVFCLESLPLIPQVGF